ncbi:MAG TPA: ABC transporter permease [Dermatophilaceae bacterium]|nr:ABC transporter permease [Dermatophilaceae bacterium]
MTTSIWQWLTSGASWAGPDGIGARLWEHVWYSALVIALATVVAVPLGLWVGHTGRARWLVAAANAARAVPTLGLLFAVTLWVGPRISGDLAFVVPSILVLVLLAVPPILAGTYAGIEAVDPAVRDAAAGMGMTGGQVLRQVELPCALPLLFSGVRSAVLQVVATATIAAYVGLGGLGRFLIDGLAVRDLPQTAGGAVLVALLAIVADSLFAVGQRYAVSPGVSGRAGGRRSRRAGGPAEGGAGGRAEGGAEGRAGGAAGDRDTRPADVDLATSG